MNEISKIRIKLGPIEIEYEGREEFLKTEVPELVTSISKLYPATGFERALPPGNGSAPETALGTVGTTGSIAAKLRVTSGGDLVLAAAARLDIGEGRETFSRDELLAEMKSASRYFKETYRKSLSGYLGTLVKDGKLVETTKDTYALSATGKAELETALAS